MLTELNEREALFHADNLLDVLSYLSDVRPRWNQRASRQSSYGSDWDLRTNYEQAVNMARYGWDEGVRKLQSLIAQVPTHLKPTKRYGVAGEHSDVGRFITGDPMNMVRRMKELKPRGTVTIVCNMVASCSIGAESIANFGAAVCVLVDRLESQQIRCELIGCIAIDDLGQRGKFTLAWGIKQSEDILDLAALAFSFGHPAMLRRLCFALMETLPAPWENSYYGVPAKASIQRILQCPRDALVINGVGHNPGRCNTITNALVYAKDQINQAALAAGGTEIAELEAVGEFDYGTA